MTKSNINSVAHITIRPSMKKPELIVVTNQDFINTIFDKSPALACTKPGNPEEGGWKAFSAETVTDRCPDTNNNYFNCSSFHFNEDGDLNARKENFAACHALVLDDVGTKIPSDELKAYTFSWKLETSPGNYQYGLIFDAPVDDGEKVTLILDAFIAKGWCDAGASGPMSRWARLPVGINGKPKYRHDDGKPFQCRLAEWNPDVRYSPDQMAEVFELDLSKKKPVKPSAQNQDRPHAYDRTGDVYFPVNVENPVITALKNKSLYKTPLGSGKHDVTCPWVEQHTDAVDSGTAYFEPDDHYPIGGFSCMHSHRDKYHISELLEHLDIKKKDIRHKSVILIVPGEMHRVIEAGEMALAKFGRHYQSGGLICTVYTDPKTGNPEISETSMESLTKALSMATAWKKYDKRTKSWEPCDPPVRHCRILYLQKEYTHFPILKGIARQPYFRENDGELVTTPGYDVQTNLFGVFDPGKYEIPESTPEFIATAKHKIDALLDEFSFASEFDKAATISAIFTAVVRSTLPHAPAFHVRAPVFGSGKSYLCEVITPFAGPGNSLKVSYPKTAEEATKAMLSLLMKNPAVIEFDDMDTDWIPHGTINRILSAEHITDRILGVSKTATVSTRSLILGSGNNVGPIRDLLRRVVTINLDPKCATPATKKYRHDPVATVKADREDYVSAVLTIIKAWQQAGSPRADVEPIATYNGLWSDYCRHTLIWLGYPDPATTLIEQLKHDPDAEPLLNLMRSWYACFQSQYTTVRKALSSNHSLNASEAKEELIEALKEFPVLERGQFNNGKIGYIMKRNIGRIVDGYHIERGEADGRTAWRVVYEPAE